MTVEPRIVDIRYSFQLTHAGNRINILCSSTPIPATLQTCREARNARLYQRFRPSTNNKEDEQKTSQRYVWVNFDIDMVLLDFDQLDRLETDGHLIKRLRFVGECNEHWVLVGGHNDLRNFPNVTEIQVIHSEKSDFEHRHGASQYYWPCGEENVLFIDPNDGKEMTLPELELKFDRIWTQIERDNGTGWVYYRGIHMDWPADAYLISEQ